MIKVNNSIATKMCANLLNNCKSFELFLVRGIIKCLNYVVHYLNVKINWKLVEKINAELCSALK